MPRNSFRSHVVATVSRQEVRTEEPHSDCLSLQRMANCTSTEGQELTNSILFSKQRLCEEQRLEAAQMTFLRHLLRITKLDKEKIQCIREKTGAQNIVKEIKQYQKKWLQSVQRMDTNRLTYLLHGEESFLRS